jgi:hypothetical protein
MYRVAVDSIYMNAANAGTLHGLLLSVDSARLSLGSRMHLLAVWAMIGSGVLYYLVIGLLVFLFLWPQTSEFMMTLLAWCLGLGGTTRPSLSPDVTGFIFFSCLVLIFHSCRQ